MNSNCFDKSDKYMPIVNKKKLLININTINRIAVRLEITNDTVLKLKTGNQL